MLFKRYFILSVLLSLCLCGVAGAWTVDLDIEGVADAAEENPGGFIALNDDDDDDNHTADKDESGPVSDED